MEIGVFLPLANPIATAENSANVDPTPMVENCSPLPAIIKAIPTNRAPVPATVERIGGTDSGPGTVVNDTVLPTLRAAAATPVPGSGGQAICGTQAAPLRAAAFRP